MDIVVNLNRVTPNWRKLWLHCHDSSYKIIHIMFVILVWLIVYFGEFTWRCHSPFVIRIYFFYFWFQLFLNRLCLDCNKKNQPNERNSKINNTKKKKDTKKRSKTTTTANNANYFVSVWVGFFFCMCRQFAIWSIFDRYYSHFLFTAIFRFAIVWLKASCQK